MGDGQTSSSLDKLRARLEFLREGIRELEQGLEELDSASDAAVPQRDAASLSADAVAGAAARLGLGETQEEILRGLLDELTLAAERALLFVSAEDSYIAHEAVGFEAPFWRGLTADLEGPVAEALESREAVQIPRGGKRPAWMDRLRTDGTAVLIPLFFQERAPLLLYLDSTRSLDVGTAQVLAQLAKLMLQNRYLHYLLDVERGELREYGRWTTLEALSVPPVIPVREAFPTLEEIVEPAAEPPAEAPPAEEAIVEEPSPRAFAETEPLESAPVAPESPPAQPPDREARPPDWEAEPPTFETPPEIPRAPEEFAEPASLADEEAQEATGDRIYELEPLSRVAAEELGLSDDEFEKLMGQASLDWKEEAPAATEVTEAAAADVPEPVEMETADVDEEVSAAEVAPSGEAEEVPISDEVSPEEMEEVPVAAQAARAGEEAAEFAREISSLTEEEQALHSEARRFARLLVAEIKLYNASEVEEGRSQGDLYPRLQGDIDRSREMYEKRVHPRVRERMDYFHSEVVRVLAQEDPRLLGPDYPGPRGADASDGL